MYITLNYKCHKVTYFADTKCYIVIDNFVIVSYKDYVIDS